jgi:hypothetical protein
VSDHEDPQFRNWLTARMNAANLSQAESDLSESEQREFDSWLASRARESSLLDEDDE